MTDAALVAIPNPFAPHIRTVEKVRSGVPVSDLYPEGWEKVVPRINGKLVDPDAVVRSGDCVLLYQSPAGETLANFVVNLLISIAVSAVFALLFPPPKPKQRRDDESSPTYSFSGVTNNRSEGQPIAVVYGKILFGGTIANEFIQVQGVPPKSTLRQLISLGEGPIHSIGGITEDTPAAVPLTGNDIPETIYINGNPARNFRDVKVWLRMGSNEQDLIPGFDETRTTAGVGSELVAEETVSAVTSGYVNGFTVDGATEYGTANDPVWEDNAVTVDFSSEDVDGFVITLRFPAGYYYTNPQTGSTQSAFFGYQVRYIELDGGGSPIATGGYAGDGYVRLPPQGPQPLQERSSFQVQIAERFIDPQNYTPGTPGFALLTTTTSGSNASYAVSTGGYATGFEIPHLGGFAWVKLDDVDAGTHNVFESYDGGANRGFGLRVVPYTFVGGTKYVLQFYFGRGSRTIYQTAGRRTGAGTNPQEIAPSSLAGGLFDGADGVWVHVGFRYLQNSDVQLCVNGQAVDSFITLGESPNNIDLEWVRRALNVGDDTSAMCVDDVKLYDDTILLSHFALDYSNGVGSPAPLLGLEDSMIFRSSFEDSAGTNVATSAEDWWATTPTLNGGATSGAATGIVRATVNAGLKRSRYRVEIVRTTQKSTSSSVANEAEVESVSSVISESFTYPNSPLIGVEADATDQLNGGAYTTTAVVQGVECPIWDGESTLIPAFRYEWSANPAWCALHHVLNTRYGLGRFYTWRQIDLVQWKAWADYCDEIVYDGTRIVTIDNPGTSNNADLYFDNSVVDPSTGETRGAIWFEVGIEEEATLPRTWEVGRHIILDDLPTDANPGVDVDPNSPADTGYEIYSVELLAGVWTVKCYWDRTAEGDPWTSGSRLGADILDPTDLDNGTVRGASRRFEFNGVFDKVQPAWDSLLDICAVGRATPVPVGSKLTVRYSHPRSPVGIVTPANIEADSFEVDFSSPRTRPNALTLSILDAEQQYEPVPIQVQADDLSTVANQSFIRTENRTLFGVTDAGQAERHGKFIVNTNALQRRSGKFVASLDALPYQVGDLLRVSSEVLPRGSASRCAGSATPIPQVQLQSGGNLSSGNWTAVGCTVTDNAASGPLGGTAADTLEDGYISQSLRDLPLDDGWVTVSCFVKDDSSGAPVIELVTGRGASSVALNLSTGAVSFTSTDAAPVRGRALDAGSGWWHFWATFYMKADDGARQVTAAEVRLFPAGESTGSAHFDRVSATLEQHPSCAVPNRMLVLGDALEVEAATTYEVYLQDFRGRTYNATLDTTLTPVGSYEAGDPVFVDESFGTIATRGAPYIIASSSEELIVELSGVRRRPDLTAEFTWVEYVPEVYDDGAVEVSTSGASITVDPNSPPPGSVAPARPPGRDPGGLAGRAHRGRVRVTARRGLGPRRLHPGPDHRHPSVVAGVLGACPGPGGVATGGSHERAGVLGGVQLARSAGGDGRGGQRCRDHPGVPVPPRPGRPYGHHTAAGARLGSGAPRRAHGDLRRPGGLLRGSLGRGGRARAGGGPPVGDPAWRVGSGCPRGAASGGHDGHPVGGRAPGSDRRQRGAALRPIVEPRRLLLHGCDPGPGAHA